MATGSPANLARKDRLEPFFEGRGHGQTFDDHVVQGHEKDMDSAEEPQFFYL
jgi:hypothetical protein